MTTQIGIRGELAACRGSLLRLVLFSACINVLMLVPVIYMLQLYDRVLTSGSRETLLMLSLIMVFLFLALGGLEWARSQILVKISNRLHFSLATPSFDLAYQQSLASTAPLVQPVADLSGLRQFLSSPAVFGFLDAPWVPVYLAVMFLFHPAFGWLGLAAVILLGTLALLNQRASQPPLRQAERHQVAAAEFARRSLHNADVVSGMGMLGNLRRRWSLEAEQMVASQNRAGARSAAFSSSSRTLRLLLQSSILGVGALLVLNFSISPGMMIAGSILLGRALAPVDQLIGVWPQFSMARQQYQRLNEGLLSTPPETDSMSLPAPTGAVSLEQLSVVAPGTSRLVLGGINLNIQAGEVVAIIGPSAAGKSSLARAILGIWPAQSGKVRLDGADIDNWPRSTLGPHLGYLPQDVELFDGSIADNIARFGSVDPDAVVAAAHSADVHAMILRLPEGYDTRIGGRAGILSAGQRQRIGLARALYKTPALVVLDEPNSNLDDSGDAALISAIAQLRQLGTTVVVISHRRNILQPVDKVLVLHEGKQALWGPRDEVLEKLDSANQLAAARRAQSQRKPDQAKTKGRSGND